MLNLYEPAKFANFVYYHMYDALNIRRNIEKGITFPHTIQKYRKFVGLSHCRVIVFTVYNIYILQRNFAILLIL